MSTKLGKTTKNYGKKYGIVSTHLSGEEILNATDLIPNSLIVSSPFLDGVSELEGDLNGNQVAHSLLFTDYEGNAARLTYTILPGNGLVVNAYDWPWNSDEKPYTVDTLTMEIDHDSLKTTNEKGQLYVSKPDIIDNYTLMVHQSLGSPHTYIGVITANLEKATDVKYGITRGDNNTISANEGILSVNTENLQYVDDTLDQNGIVRHNPDTPENAYIRTIEATDGVLRVITANLDRASAETVGVVQPDFITTATDINGMIGVLTEGLEKAAEYTYGIVRPDNYTIQIAKDSYSYNVPGVLYANAENMTPTRIEDGVSYFGVIKLDSYSFGIDRANTTYVNRYPEIAALLDRYLKDYDYIISWLIDHENRITALENQAAAEYIYSFNNYGTNITTLDKPYWDEETETVHSEEKYYSVQFSINTNCKFHISVRYENNVSKPITLHSVRLGDNPVVNASGLSQYVFNSTNRNESTLNFTFLCDNYTSSNNEANTPTIVKLRVSSINDASIYKEGAHIFNRWNTTPFIQPKEPDPVTDYVPIYTYEYVVDGNPEIKFIKSTNDNNTIIDGNIAQYVNTVNQGSKSNVSFYYTVTQKIMCNTTKYVEKYVDGVLEDRQEESTESEFAYMAYLSVPLATEMGRVSSNYYLYPNVFNYTRDVSINEDADKIGREFTFDNNTWALDNTNQNWVSLATTAISSGTARHTATNSEDADQLGQTSITSDNANKPTFTSASTVNNESSDDAIVTGGFNVMNVITTTPASTFDRMAAINLILRDIRDINALTPQTLTLYYIDDVTISNCNVNIEAMCRTNAETPLKIHIIKTPGSNPTTNTWKVNIQYCLKNNYGNAISASGTSLTIEVAEVQQQQAVAQSSGDRGSTSSNGGVITSSTPTTSTTNVDDSRTSTNETNKDIWENNSSLNRLSVSISKNYSDVVLNFTSSQIYATDINGSTISSSDISIDTFGVSKIPPQSVFDILGGGTSSVISTTSNESLTGTSGRTSAENNCSGFEIINATVDFGSLTAAIGDVTEQEGVQSTQNKQSSSMNVTWNSSGSWPTNTVAQSSVTFGNASITNITVKPWDDTRMQFEIMIRPGSTTAIPVGSQILVDNSIIPNCVLYNGNQPYNYNSFYDNIIISNDGWTSTGVKITMSLNNTIPVVPDPNTTTTQLVVAAQEYPAVYGINNETDYTAHVQSTQAQVYVDDRGAQTNAFVSTTSPLVTGGDDKGIGTDGLSQTSHVALGINAPLFQSMSAMKFNFRLKAKNGNNTSTMDFVASLGSFTDKIYITSNYSNGASKDINPPMINAFYSGYAGSTTEDIIEKEENASAVAQMAEELETLKEQINALTSTTTTTGTTNAEYQPLVGGDKINVGDSTTMYSATTHYGDEY